jgi:diaminohydroxyphosphoribosylaminopyrimidine deaminase/5-amino-6-(5-phosphoribosylamino)uracil reductase
MSVGHDDAAWMKRALSLAKKAEGDTGHYPMVGAVIVRNGKLISEGYFCRPGAPHAEIRAIDKAGPGAKGATLVLNLEPCSHFGRTPPCADAVIKAGIKRVVAGMTDPNPLVTGNGFKKLRAAGIKVTRGVLEKECGELNRAFVKFITTGTPWIIMKAAATLDGKIATSAGDSKWITGEAARKRSHKLRDVCQAVMVGAGTVRADDCELTARLAGKGRRPRPAVVTSGLDIPRSCKVMRTPAADGPLLFCTKKANSNKMESFRKAGAEVVVVRKDREGRADLEAVALELGKRNIASVLLEGGAGLFGSALGAGLVDEVVLFLAPKLVAGDGVSMTRGKGVKKIADAMPLTDMKVRRIGSDLMITARVAKEAKK